MSKKQDSSEDITLDFSWIKNIFSGKSPKSKRHQKSSKDDDELNIEFNSISKLFVKYGAYLLILIPIILSIYLRLMPAQLPVADDWTRQGIINNLRTQVINDVNQKYPNLPQQNKDVLINQQLDTVLSAQQNQIEQAIQQQSQMLRERFRNENGETYLGDIDSYFWTRYARNIIEKGTFGDEVVDGQNIDTHMSAPNGFKITPSMYPYIEAYLYKFLRIFNSEITIMRVAYLTPLYLSFIAIIAAFLIGKKLSGNFSGFIASVLIAVNPTVLSRSFGSDNDIVNIVFPLLIMLFTMYAFDSKKLSKTILLSSIVGFLIGLYSFAWSGWWFMFLFICGAAIIYLGYIGVFELISKGKTINNLMNNKKVITIGVLVIVLFASTFVTLAMFGKQSTFVNVFFKNPYKIVTITAASRGASIWPNVYTTVAELNAANIDQIINSLGGVNFLWIALIGTILALVNFSAKKTKQKIINYLYLGGSILYFFIFLMVARSANFNMMITVALLSIPMFVGLLLSSIFSYKVEPAHAIIMTIWFMATIYASTKGIRFILLIVPAFVISFAAFFGIVIDKVSNLFSKLFDLNATIPKAIFIFATLFILIQPYNAGKSVAYSYAPSINDAWVEALTKINTESEPDAIINSWWDFGHWFKFWADRAVTFDGASQNSQQAHWIGKVLMTQDEEQAIAILRMLDCGGTNAEAEVRKTIDDPYLSVKTIYTLLELDEVQARIELSKIIQDQQKIDEIISYMYCEPPENYFITSHDMVGKSGVWAHFGSWNFERAKLYNYFKESNGLDEFNQKVDIDLVYDDETKEQLYYDMTALITDRQINDWIAPWPSYGGVVGCSIVSEDVRRCNLPAGNNQAIPMEINLTSMDAYVNVNGQILRPNNFGYLDSDDEFIIKEYDENNFGYGVTLIEGNNVVFMSEELTGSMFTRLFYMDGKGLNSFEKFHEVFDVSGQRISTWKVNWQE
jgi:dolichyl-phosphooligosaccharide-protein glycotransferase